MSERKVLLDLADRCEREGPCAELDEAIALVCGWERSTTSPIGWWLPPNGDAWRLSPSRYTASLDAAVTLVPDEWNWAVERFTFDALMPYKEAGAKASAWHDSRNPKERIFNIEAATPALALCAAALRARAHAKEE